MSSNFRSEELCAFLVEYNAILVAFPTILSELEYNPSSADIDRLYLLVSDLVGIAEFTDSSNLIEIATILQQYLRFILDEGSLELDFTLLRSVLTVLNQIYQSMEDQSDLPVDATPILARLQSVMQEITPTEDDALNMEDDEKEIFVNELSEHIEQYAAACDLLTAAPPDSVTIFNLFKSMHTVKGFAAIIDFTELHKLAGLLEKLFQAVKDKKLDFSDELVGIMQASRDLLLNMLDDILENKHSVYSLEELLDQIQVLLGEGNPTTVQDYDLAHNNFLATRLEFTVETRHVAEQLLTQGGTLFDVILTFDKDAEMKSVRCFQILEELKNNGTIVALFPVEYDVVTLNLVDVGLKIIYYSDKRELFDIKNIISSIFDCHTLSVTVREV